MNFHAPEARRVDLLLWGMVGFTALPLHITDVKAISVSPAMSLFNEFHLDPYAKTLLY